MQRRPILVPAPSDQQGACRGGSGSRAGTAVPRSPEQEAPPPPLLHASSAIPEPSRAPRTRGAPLGRPKRSRRGPCPVPSYAEQRDCGRGRRRELGRPRAAATEPRGTFRLARDFRAFRIRHLPQIPTTGLGATRRQLLRAWTAELQTGSGAARPFLGEPLGQAGTSGRRSARFQRLPGGGGTWSQLRRLPFRAFPTSTLGCRKSPLLVRLFEEWGSPLRKVTVTPPEPSQAHACLPRPTRRDSGRRPGPTQPRLRSSCSFTNDSFPPPSPAAGPLLGLQGPAHR